MTLDLFTRLQEAESEEARQWLLLELNLARLPEPLAAGLWVAAVPHWFDRPYLEALLEAGTLAAFTAAGDIDALLSQHFIEIRPGKGFNIHDRTRTLLLKRLWETDPERYRMLSGRAAAFCAAQGNQNREWRIEEIYHLLVSDPAGGLSQLRRQALTWQNFPFHAYDAVEALAAAAQEHAAAGRLGDAGRGWTLFWQAHQALLYGRDAEALAALESIGADLAGEPELAAERNQALGDLYARAGRHAEAQAAYSAAIDAFEMLGRGINAAALRTRLDGDKTLPAAEPGEPAEASGEPGRIRHQLLANIQAVWIDGVLNQSLQQEIALEVEQLVGGLNQVSRLVLHTEDQIDRPLPAAFSLDDAFEHSSRSLLILGAPGSGKTTLLLKLLAALLAEARRDQEAPIPLLLNLSSWRKKRGDLADWLQQEGKQQYKLSPTFIRDELLAPKRLILLLDGLDEVPLAERSSCVTTINRFLEREQIGLVVSSRTADYDVLETRLALAGTVVVQPLSTTQIDAFLAQGGERWDGLRATIQQERDLRELVRTPLMLNLLTLVGHDLSLTELARLETTEAASRYLYERFVAEMFRRRPLEKEGVKTAQAKGWLSILARRMQADGRSQFFIEALQPELLTSGWRRLYDILVAAAVGLTAFPPVFLIGLFGISLANIAPSNILLNGVIFIAGTVLITQFVSRFPRQKWRFPLATILGTLLLGTATPFLLLLDLFASSMDTGFSYILLTFGLIIGLSPGLVVGLTQLSPEISLVERPPRIRPRWRRFTSAFGWGFLVGGAVFTIAGLLLVVGMSVDMRDLQIDTAFLTTFMVVTTGIIFPLLGFGIGGLIIGLLAGLISFIEPRPVDRRLQPGRGLRLSLRNGFWIPLGIFVAAAVLTVLTLAISGGYSLLVLAVLILMWPAAFLYFGGLAAIQHLILRGLLTASYGIPLRLNHFLQMMTRRALLRQVGGGYMFIHRAILEYFASLKE